MRHLLCAVMLASSCTSSPAEAPRDAEPHHCLELVWRHQNAPNKAFDLKHDQHGDDSISCAILSSPSAVERQLRSIRLAASASDVQALASTVGYPLTLIDKQGRKRQVSKTFVMAHPRAVFTPDVLEILSHATLSRLEVVRNKGAYFAAGAVWFSVASPGANPKITTINLSTISARTGNQK